MKIDINVLNSNELKLLNYVKNDIDFNDLTEISNLLTSYINNPTITKEEKRKIENTRNRILSLLYLMINSDDLAETIGLRNSFNYYARKIKNILLNNNINIMNLTELVKMTKKDIQQYIRYLKRKENIKQIELLSKSTLDSDKKLLKKLLKNEKAYQKKNIKKESSKIRKKANSVIITRNVKKKSINLKKRVVSMLLASSIGICSYITGIFSKKVYAKDIDLGRTKKIELKVEIPEVPDSIEYLEESSLLVMASSIKNDAYKNDTAVDFDGQLIILPKEKTVPENLSDYIIKEQGFIDKEAEDLNYICEKEGITLFEFYSIVSCIAHEGGKDCYKECYDVLVSIRNRTISSLWVNDCERYTHLDGTSIYNQMIWRDPWIQYSGYHPNEAGYDQDEYKYTQAYYAAIDFFLSGEKYHEVRTHNYKSFNTHGKAPTSYPHQLNPETRGNDFYAPLKESELIFDDISLDVSHDIELVRTK